MSLLLNQYKKVSNDDSSVVKRDAYAKLFILTSIGIIGNFALGLLLFVLYLGIAAKPPPALVQLEDGTAILTKPVSSLDRTDKALETFVRDIFGIIYTWSGSYPNNEGEWVEDTGVTVQDSNGKKLGLITTPAWEASFALNLKFRETFLRKLAEIVPQSVFSNRTEVALVPLRMLPPQKVSEGKWKVVYLTNLLFIQRQTRKETIIPYNVEVYVKAVPPNSNSLVSQLKEAKSKSVALDVVNARQGAMEIESIVPYQQQDLK